MNAKEDFVKSLEVQEQQFILSLFESFWAALKANQWHPTSNYKDPWFSQSS